MKPSAPLARLLLVVVNLLSLLPAAAVAGTEPAGNMTGSRQGHVAVGLADGRALLAGGSLSTAETYDPLTATFTATGSMSTSRLYAASARLADGRVLVAGGTAASNLATAEIYDPVAGTWSATTGSMSATRTGAVAITLASGQVLVIAGDTTARACELYDPATGLFTPTGQLGTARVRAAASVLPDGRVLVAGGQPLSGSLYHSSVEIWDPVTGTWTPAGSMAAARSGASATLLGDGRVLLAGGITTNDTRSAVAVAELYDPAAGTFSAAGTMVLKRSRHTASLMGDGNVLVAGGLSGVNSSDTAAIEIYDTATSTWRNAGSMMQRRYFHAAAALADGDVLITGGSAPANTAEIVDAACTATLASITPATASFTLEGGSGSVAITHTAGCAWRVLGVTDWITFTSPTMGLGGGTVTYNVALSNVTYGRGSNLTVADSTYNVSQAANPCSNASLSPASQSFSYVGGSNSASLSVDANCTWTVSAVPAWISIMSGATGSTGIPYTVAANPGGARSATLSIANRNLAVSQTANPCVPAPTITPASRTFPFGGGTNTVAITAPLSCPWTVVGAPPWIAMSAWSGSGNNTLTVTASANTGPERTTTFTVAGNPFTVTQAANACADATISPTSVSWPNGSGTGTIELIAPAACAWSTSFIPSWITFTSPTSGSGSATLAYSYAANAAGTRTVTLVIAGRSFAVTQAAATCFPASSISPSSVTASATGGIDTRTVSVTASPGCPWAVSSVPPWVTLTDPSSGTGNGTVTYSIAGNSGAARSATMVIAGRNFSLNQSAPGLGSLPTGHLQGPRATHVAVGLADGRALVIGGITASGYANVTPASEIYDPATETFSTTGSMIQGRTEHAAVRLADGRVLAVGGTRSPGIVVATAELYDPATGAWSATGSMSAPRRWPMLVALADGRALVLAGDAGFSALATAEIYDPATGTFTPTGSLLTARLQGAVVELADGRVLALGGTTTTAGLASSEIWSPATGAWTPGGNMTVARSDYPFATVLSDGRVLVVAGYAPFGADNTAELYDPSTGVFTRTGSLHYAHTLGPIGVTLADGTVFLLGGDSGRNVERYRAATQTWQVVGQLSDARTLWTASALGNGKVLAAGGFAGPSSSAEVFDPAVCSLSGGLSSVFQAFPGTGGSASITVALTPGCPRTISTDVPSWITITGGGAGSGSGTVTYSVAANGTGVERGATFSIAGAPHMVAQAPGPPPPPPSYCASKGNTSSWEWIQQVTVAGTVRSSGNNAGYANFTSNPAIALARGANTIALQAGGGYSESWRVWIDFNRDSVFSDSEIVYTGSGAGTLSSSITVPASALAGNTRMRISMKYGASPTACETFSYGEVEDYTVTIP